MLESLKDNLSKYKSYYNKNLEEELYILERIYNLEKEIENKQKEEQISLLEKANDQIKNQLKERLNFLTEQHKKELKMIDERRDEEIKALRSVHDEKKSLLDRERKEQRISEIDQVLERYKQSSTFEGQQRYRELIREREDLELELQEQSIKIKEEEKL